MSSSNCCFLTCIQISTVQNTLNLPSEFTLHSFPPYLVLQKANIGDCINRLLADFQETDWKISSRRYWKIPYQTQVRFCCVLLSKVTAPSGHSSYTAIASAFRFHKFPLYSFKTRSGLNSSLLLLLSIKFFTIPWQLFFTMKPVDWMT